MDWENGQFSLGFFSREEIWRNVSLSRDGNRIAAVTVGFEPKLLVFDLESGNLKSFDLYNPTYTSNTTSNTLLFADAIEWDFSGEKIFFDAYNEINSRGVTNSKISFWDISIIDVWDNIGNTFADGDIRKLITGLNPTESIGNPKLSKNSPNIISFDYLKDDDFFIVTYDLLKNTSLTSSLHLLDKLPTPLRQLPYTSQTTSLHLSDNLPTPLRQPPFTQTTSLHLSDSLPTPLRQPPYTSQTASLPQADSLPTPGGQPP